ncbi:HDOD domain-containing protein [Vibrio hepatarius]|jgi:HD-like signal output (HDOD) protein|uniref:Histidine kinase n=1 Tax=Vibrio hepatarius TaxID=171383 RepID=A0A0M0I1K8_9VIBR|nr:HDOD domain-containing protein [Vibrio hepatarius]KOO08229.1 histidine kinase [Vibrio hepatarius]NOI13221.1 HDOD domain-containing protein [Vibrio hepatarius]
MNHLSFYWLPQNKDLLVKGIESEFSQLVEHAVSSKKIALPPIPEVVLKIQKLCTQDNTTVSDVADCLLEDPGLAAIVIRVANSVIFNRRNITCTDLVTAVSRLGILRVRDIVTAQAIEQLKHSVNLSSACNRILMNSAINSRELAATMVMVVRGFRDSGTETYQNLEADKALLTGLLADIGLFCIVNEYHCYLEQGNYLAEDIAFQVFDRLCSNASELVLDSWGFDEDFIEVASNKFRKRSSVAVSYLDVARIANHILLFRRQDDAIDEHSVKFDVTGADILYKLSNLSDIEFNAQVDELMSASGL